MANRTKIILIMALVFAQAVFAPKASAAASFKDINVSGVENGSAKLKWYTDQLSAGDVYYGENINSLNKTMGYSLYNNYHELALTGLKKNKTYYYKIVALEISGNRTESFMQSFSTNGMKKEEVADPIFEDKKVLQVINTAAALAWTTNEETSAIIYFRADSEKTAKKASYGRFDKQHEMFLYGLRPDEIYYLEISASDKSGNQSSEFLALNTHVGKENIPNLAISNIKPLSFDGKLIFPRSAEIKWETNFVAKSYILYGKDPKNLSKKADASLSHKLNHSVILSDLEPGTVYFYRINAYDSFFSKQINAAVMSFMTAPLSKKLTDGSLVKGSGYKVYVIGGNEKLWIQTADVFKKLGYKWQWIQKVDDIFLNEYKEGKSINSVKSHPNGTLIKYPDSASVYLLENQKKRPFSSADAFVRLGYDWNKIITITKNEAYRNGEYL